MGSELFAGVAGLIGAGKTTLTLDLARAMDAEAYLEPVVENPYLADFYKEKDRYGFTMQIYLLNERFRQHQEVVWRRRRAIQDRTIYEDTIFAEMLREAGYMTARDYETYINLFTNMTHFLQRPTVILYLDTTPEHALENVTARARGCETGLPLDYLRDLRAGYEKWYERMKNRLTIVRVPWDDFGKSLDMAALVREYAPDARWGQKF